MKIEYKNKKKTVSTRELVEGNIYKDRDGDVVLVSSGDQIFVLHGENNNDIYDIYNIYSIDDIFTELNCTLTIEE